MSINSQASRVVTSFYSSLSIGKLCSNTLDKNSWLCIKDMRVCVCVCTRKDHTYMFTQKLNPRWPDLLSFLLGFITGSNGDMHGRPTTCEMDRMFHIIRDERLFCVRPSVSLIITSTTATENYSMFFLYTRITRHESRPQWCKCISSVFISSIAFA